MSRIDACIPSIGKSAWLPALVDRLNEDDVAVRIYVNSERIEGSICDTKCADICHRADRSIYGAWNRAAEFARHYGIDYLMLCNDDIEILPGTARALADAMDANPEYGAISVGEQYLCVAPGAVTPLSHQADTRRGFLQWCFVARVEAWQDVDPRYQIWYGDDDLIWKLNAAGWLTGALAGVGAIHYTSTTISQTPWVNEAAGHDGQIWAQEHS